MADMGKTVVKKVGEREVICHELTVQELRAMLARQGEDLLDLALFEQIRLQDLAVMTGQSAEVLENLRPSELRVLVDGCREANPDFFAMLQRLARPTA